MGSKYAPRSPDLSGYAPQSPDLTSYRPQSPSFGAAGNNYAPQSPDLSGVQSYQGAGQQVPSYNLDQHQPLQHQQLQHLSQQHQPPPQWTQQHTSYPQPQQPQQQQQQLYPGLPQQIHPLHQQYQQDPYATYPLQQQHSSPTYPPQHYTSFPDTMPAQTRTSNRTQPRSYAEPADNEFDYAPPAAEYMPPPTIKAEDSEFNLQQDQEVPPPPTPARRGRKPKSETQANGSGSMAQPALQKMDTGGVEVKTKFPTARIKRIMQADEDVGKVAQVTPVVVAKALELFMIRLITSSANVAKSRGSKKVMSQHMKSAVMQDDQFDNLRDIMAKVPDAPTSKNGAKDEDDDEEGSAPKPKGRGKGKKRRDSDDF